VDLVGARGANLCDRLTAGTAPLGSDWTRYYDAAGDEPRRTLLYALGRFDEEGARERLAVDLGCGTGRDTAELLRRGWRVLAIDGEAEAIERLRARRDLLTEGGDRLRTRIEPFDEAEWPEADLVNSSFALPFCPPGAFPAVWARIGASLRPGGRFAGQLFGDRDEWSAEQDMTFHTRGQVEAMLESLAVEHLEEIEEDGSTATGKKKHWHVFHVVARKRPRSER
jgi:tellurite methyltransferase